MKPRRPSSSAPRDQQRETAFATILSDLIVRVPGARAAALVDRDGETVDYAGEGNPYEMRVAAAHFRIVLDEALSQPALSSARSLLVRASRASFAVHALPDGYALVLRLTRGAGFRGLGRAIPACTRSLAIEAGWKPISSGWYALDVISDERRAPRALRALARDPAKTAAKTPENTAPREIAVEVLGRFRVALPEHERAWRVRISSGAEFTLVREAGGFWYSDEPVAV